MTGLDEAIRTRLWRGGEFEKEDFSMEQIPDHLASHDCLVWVDVRDPDHEKMKVLAGALGLHPAAVEDAIAHSERAKATRYGGYTFLTAYSTPMPTENSRDLNSPALHLGRVSVFVFPRGLVTVRPGESFAMEEVVRRWDASHDLLVLGVGALVYGLLDGVVDSHVDAVQVLDDMIEGLEDSLLDDAAVSREIQRRTCRVRKNLVQLRRVVLPMRELVNTVLRHHQGGHHRRAHGGHRVLRPEHPLPGLRSTTGGVRECRHHRRSSGSPVRPVQEAGMAVTGERTQTRPRAENSWSR